MIFAKRKFIFDYYKTDIGTFLQKELTQETTTEEYINYDLKKRDDSDESLESQESLLIREPFSRIFYLKFHRINVSQRELT